MSILVPDEISMEDPLCDSSFGSMVTLDYVNPLTELEGAELVKDPVGTVLPSFRSDLVQSTKKMEKPCEVEPCIV